jgi:uncharacterized membrane protein YesL
LDAVIFWNNPNVPFNVPVLKDTLANTVPDVTLLALRLVPVAFVNIIFDIVPFDKNIFACVSVAILKLAMVIDDTTPLPIVLFILARFVRLIVPVLTLVLANIVPDVKLDAFNVPTVNVVDNTF